MITKEIFKYKQVNSSIKMHRQGQGQIRELTDRIHSAAHDLEVPGKKEEAALTLKDILTENSARIRKSPPPQYHDPDWFISYIGPLDEAYQISTALSDACKKYPNFVGLAQEQLQICLGCFDVVYDAQRSRLAELRLSQDVESTEGVLGIAKRLYASAPEPRKARYAGLVIDCYQGLMAKCGLGPNSIHWLEEMEQFKKENNIR